MPSAANGEKPRSCCARCLGVVTPIRCLIFLFLVFAVWLTLSLVIRPPSLVITQRFCEKGKVITSLANSSDGRLLAIGILNRRHLIWQQPSGIGSLKVLDLKDDRDIFAATVDFYVFSVAFSSDGEKLWVAGGIPTAYPRLFPGDCHGSWAGRDGRIQCWDLKTGKTLVTLPFNSSATSVAMSPDGRLLAGMIGLPSHDTNGYLVQIWDATTLKEVSHFSLDGIDMVPPSFGPRRHLVFSPDGRFLAAAASGGTIPKDGLQAARSSDGDLYSGEVVIYDVKKAQIIQKPIPTARYVLSYLSFSEDGKVLLTAAGGYLSIWESNERRLSHPLGTLACEWIPKSDLILQSGVFCEKPYSLLLWRYGDPVNVWCTGSFPEHATALCVARDGERFFTGYETGDVLVWKIPKHTNEPRIDK